jgi:aldehyde:ferredoxin oxidoreductase
VALTGKTAYINLTSGEIKIDSVPAELLKRFLGGRGLDIYLLTTWLKENVDPLGADNVVIVSTGLLTGTLASMSGRTHIASKSPLTGYLGGANLGGFFAPELRMAGFDHLVITGKAKKPVFLLVNDGILHIRDASMIWGQTAPDTQEILRKELEDDDIQTICIGPAGENQVRFASVMTRHQGASGRTGMGAIFGAKNLKAVVARGKGCIHIEHPEEALEYDHKIVHNITSSEFGHKMQSLGVSSIDGLGDPFSEYTIGMDGCFGCQLHCRHRYAIKMGPHAGVYGQGPGYHTQQAWEALLGENQPEAVLMANYLVNSYALDALETANLIGWAMRLWDEGILTDEEINGIDLRFGNAEAVNRIIRMIANREGFGGILAEGGARAAKKIGRDSVSFLRELKGMANIFGNQNLTPWQGLGVATATQGSDHLRFLPASDPSRLPEPVIKEIVNKVRHFIGDISPDNQEYSDIPWLVYWNEMCGMANDMLGVCDFHTVLYDPTFPSFDEFSKMIALNTGLNITPNQIWKAAERAVTLERMFNLREGYTGYCDHLDNWGYTDDPSSRGKDRSIDKNNYDSMLGRYYEIHGWDSNGVPKSDTIKLLDLEPTPGNGLRK